MVHSSDITPALSLAEAQAWFTQMQAAEARVSDAVRTLMVMSETNLSDDMLKSAPVLAVESNVVLFRNPKKRKRLLTAPVKIGSLAKSAAAVTLAMTLTLGAIPASNAGPGDVNSINNGRVIQGGTYYNTRGNATRFENSGRGGLWLKSGSNLRGIEVDGRGSTGNGGVFNFKAPGSVVRLDGNINVNALRNGQGAYLGDGGKVFVDAAYLYQNGAIYASGNRGGAVQFNVGSATLGPNARILVNGTTDSGGSVRIKGKGTIDIQEGAIISANGQKIGSFNSNLIDIDGGIVNNKGLLQANGVDSKGGNVVLIARGNSDNSDAITAIEDAAGVDDPSFSAAEAASVRDALTTLATNYDGHVRNSGDVIVNGDVGQKGGNIYMRSMTSDGMVSNSGNLSARGGDGAAGQRGGDGGNISLIAYETEHNGTIVVDGGHGGDGASGNQAGGNGGNAGTVLFSASTTQSGNGSVSLAGGVGGNGAGSGAGGNGGNGGTLYLPCPDDTGHLEVCLSGGCGGESTTQVGQAGDCGSIEAAPCDLPPPNKPPLDTPPPSDTPPPDTVVPFLIPPPPAPQPNIPAGAATVIDWDQPTNFIAQSFDTPESTLRRQLENEIAEVPPTISRAVKVKPPRFSKPVHVRGFW